VTLIHDAKRREAVLAEVDSILDRYGRLHEEIGLMPVDTYAGPSPAERLEQIEGLVALIRADVRAGEAPCQPLMLAAAAQFVAWVSASDERDECRVESGDAA
jgi:nitroreductase